ncbi:hypothetical protein C8Q75DRAFT_754199 [Abortiporus biennis]|nr:hypothetical protein C8Q75DRAFT_754199 [Abortiporus biennis]
MHTCLRATEIVQTIADYVLEDNSRQSSADLLALALTCRGFYQPALTSLWSELHSVYPITCLFPGDLYTTQISGDDSDSSDGEFPPRLRGRLVPVRPIKPADWTRFDFHARRVRVFISVESNSKPVNRDFSPVFMQMLQLHRKEPLFPNLRRLDWSSSCPHQVQFLSLFISPSLRDISLCLDSLWAVQSILGDLQISSPSIRRAIIVPKASLLFSSSGRAQVLASVYDTICSWSGLTTIVLPHVPLDKTLFLYLARLPTLIRAKIAINSNFHVEECVATDLSCPSAEFPAFPKLEKLQLFMFSVDLDYGAAVLRSITSKTFKTHFLDVTEFPTEEMLAVYIEALSNHPLLDSVRLIRHDGNRNEEILMSFKTIRPLLRNQAIKELKVDDIIFNFTDDDAHSMALSWPKLKVLSFITKDSLFRQPVNCVTVSHGLVHFIHHCPQLHYLSLPFSISAIHNEECSNQSPPNIHIPPRPATKEFTVGIDIITATTEFLVDFAARLSAVVPDANVEISEVQTLGEGMKKKVNELNKLVRKFTDIRRQERMHAKESPYVDQGCPNCSEIDQTCG